MKLFRVNHVATAVAAAGLFVGASAQAELVTGGDFDSATARSSETWQKTVTPYAFSGGTYQFRMTSGTSNGTIQQDLTTEAGQAYDFNFDFRFQGNTPSAPSALIEVIDLSDSSVIASATYNYATIGSPDNTGEPFFDMPTINFTAESTSTRIKFTGQNGVASTNLALDNVSVVESAPIPEPSSLALIAAGGGLVALRRRAKGE